MSSARIMFEKTGPAVYISHLDLVRTMQRIFVRTGVKIKHTEGFNPHPKMTFPLPLSVGTASVCEIMDAELEDDSQIEDLTSMMNSAVPEGIRFTDAWTPVLKPKELQFVRVRCSLIYDGGVRPDAVGAVRQLFSRESIVIDRKTKSGVKSADIVPMISSVKAEQTDGNTLELDAVISAQNPTLNPTGLVTAVNTFLPEYAPDFARYQRLGIYDKNLNTFR